jgi:hypothetical protein
VTIGRVLYAIGVFLIFGTVAILMARSALATFRRAGHEEDRAWLVYAAQELFPAVLAGAVAIGAPIGILIA